MEYRRFTSLYGFMSVDTLYNLHYTFKKVSSEISSYFNIHAHVSQKQLQRKMKTRFVIIECAGYTLCQLFLREV